MTTKSKVNKLYLLALKYAESDITHEEIRKRDITHIYYDEKEHMLRNDELVNAQFHGLPGSGKSTAMIAEVVHSNELLGKTTTIDHIIPNQIVYLNVMRTIQHRLDVCIGIDEFDEMGETGYDSSIDKAGLNSFSDLGREFYIHRYSCAPKDTMDKNAFLIFNVLHADKTNRTTRCLLYYKLFQGGQEIDQLIGYVDIDVGPTLDLPFYTEYYTRKKERLRLFSQHGIIHERHIFFAEILLDAYKKLRPLAIHGKVERGLVELQIDISSKQLRQQHSILGTMKFAQDLGSLLKIVTYIEKEQELIRKLTEVGKIELLEDHQGVLDRLLEQERTVLNYWKQAASLKGYYVSKLPQLDTPQ